MGGVSFLTWKKKYSRLKVTWWGGGDRSHIKEGGVACHTFGGIKKAVLVAIGVFSFKRSTVGAFGPTFYGIKLCQEKMP